MRPLVAIFFVASLVWAAGSTVFVLLVPVEPESELNITAWVTCDEIAPLWAIIDETKEPTHCRGENVSGVEVRLQYN